METTIIIPCKDNVQYTKACIESIIRNTTASYNITIVDDGSGPETQNFLEKKTPYKIIRNEKSLGFPAACNLGMRAVKSDFFVIMNNDVEVTKNWLTLLLYNMKQNQRLGILGPITNRISGPQKDCCAGYTTREGLEKHAAAVNNRKPPRLEYYPRIVFFCVLIRTELYNKIGGLDQNFGLGNFEDDDYCLRAIHAGWNCAIDYNVFIHHYGSKTFKKMGREYAQLLQKNKDYFMQKWNPQKLQKGS